MSTITYCIKEIVLEVDIVADMNVTASGRDISFEATMLGNTSWRSRAINVTRKGWNLVALVTNGEETNVRITTSKLGKVFYFQSPTQDSDTHCGKGNNE